MVIHSESCPLKDSGMKHTALYAPLTTNASSDVSELKASQKRAVTAIWTVLLSGPFFIVVRSASFKASSHSNLHITFSVVTSFGSHPTVLKVKYHLAQNTSKTNWCVYAVELSKKVPFLAQRVCPYPTFLVSTPFHFDLFPYVLFFKL